FGGVALYSRLRRRPGSPLFPYTTLFRSVTGAGLSELAAGGVRELSGFQAAFQSGQLGSTLLVARARVDGLDPTSSATAPLITAVDRKSTRLNSSHVKISYAVFCLKKKRH